MFTKGRHTDTSIELGNLYRKRDAESRSLTAENFRGEKGKGATATPETTQHPPSANAARELGPGWKLSPCIGIKAGETATIMDNDGPGFVRHVWATLDPRYHRDIILRMYWDGDKASSVECPIGDFFCCSWKQSQNIFARP